MTEITLPCTLYIVSLSDSPPMFTYVSSDTFSFVTGGSSICCCFTPESGNNSLKKNNKKCINNQFVPVTSLWTLQYRYTNSL